MLTQRSHARRRRLLRCAVSVLTVCLTATLTYAGEGYFGYDEFGRLKRAIDEQSRTTDYTYDPAGNIISIRTSIPAAAPSVAGIAPNGVRRGQSKLVQVVGQNLLSVRVTTSDPRLRVTGLENTENTDTQVTFTLTAESDANEGVQQLTFSNDNGAVSADVIVNPSVPTATITPDLIAVPPDSVPRQFQIRLSHADTIAHDISFSVADATVAAIPGVVTVPAGAMEVVLPFTGLKLGQTTFTFASSEIVAQTQQLYVTNDYGEVYKTYARPLGVVLQEPPLVISVAPIVSPVVGIVLSEPAPSFSVTSLISPLVGLTLGSAVTGIHPKAASIGNTSVLTIYGVELDGVTAVHFVPDTDITTDMPAIWKIIDGERIYQ